MNLWKIAATTVFLVCFVVVGVGIYTIVHFVLKFW